MMTPPSRSGDFLRRAEIAAACAATLAAVIGHLVVLFYSGPLWRNEVNTVNVAALPSLAEVWHNLQFDSFPILWFLVLRVWIGCGFGGDFALRLLGCGVGLAIVAMIWVAARRLRIGLPWCLLALFALNPIVIAYGDSVRAYGFGILLFLTSLICWWIAFERPSVVTLAVATISAILAIHASYQNSAFLFAVIVAAAVSAIWKGSWKLAATLIALGGLAALSLIPYVGVVREAASWNEIIRMSPFDFSWFGRKLVDALGAGLAPVWILLFFVALGWGIVALFRTRRDEAEGAAILFGVTLAIVGPVTFYWFLKMLRYFTESWYYAPLLALVALATDLIISRLRLTSRTRLVRLVVFLILAFVSVTSGAKELLTRRTNVDHAAAKLIQLASADDLIVMNEWYHAITFHRYAPNLQFVPVPSIGMPSVHRYDLIKVAMENPVTASDSARMKIADTLRSGHRVWIVGRAPQGGGFPVEISPAPQSTSGWLNGPYYEVWSNQLGNYLQANVARANDVPLQTLGVSDYEKVSLTEVSGWRTPQQ